ncbi:MAG: MarR family winged helix-turn-helix transcriptional regulator [Methyloligellaceae bacterium]
MLRDLGYDPTSVCLVLKTRRAARAITRRYNALLNPYGIQSIQASLLFAIDRGGFKSISEMADWLSIERSALTRNISLLRERGLICSDENKQGKAQKVILSADGRKLIETISPLWLQAQDAVREEVGEESWDKIQNALAAIGGL